MDRNPEGRNLMLGGNPIYCDCNTAKNLKVANNKFCNLYFKINIDNIFYMILFLNRFGCRPEQVI